MKTLLVGYDLNRPESDYPGLIDSLKQAGSAWWHHLDSTWLIKTDRSPSSLREELKPYLDADDELLVIDVTGRARSWQGFNRRGSDWLKDTYS